MAEQQNSGCINPAENVIDNLSEEFAKKRISNKIDKNRSYSTGLPLRLEIATRLISGEITKFGLDGIHKPDINLAFEVADMLIEKFNNECDEL